MEFLPRCFIIIVPTILLLKVATCSTTTFLSYHYHAPLLFGRPVSNYTVDTVEKPKSLWYLLRGGGGGPEVGGGKSGDCLRRIKREWKDAVKMGVAYDWIKQETAIRKKKSSSNNTSEDDEKFYKYNHVRIGPIGKNILRWHFSIMGPSNSEYDGGVYHGLVILPKDYPMSPPRVQVLTPSGRFETGVDICLSASAYHPEAWTPRWTVYSLVESLRLHMLTAPNEIGGINSSREKRIRFAKASRSWECGIVNHAAMIRKERLFTTKEDSRVMVEGDIEKSLSSLGESDEESSDNEKERDDRMERKENMPEDGSKLEIKLRSKDTEDKLDEVHRQQSDTSISNNKKSKDRLVYNERQRKSESLTLLILKDLFVFIFHRHFKLTLSLFGAWYISKFLFNF